jgi:hypothetical protein
MVAASATAILATAILNDINLSTVIGHPFGGPEILPQTCKIPVYRRFAWRIFDGSRLTDRFPRACAGPPAGRKKENAANKVNARKTTLAKKRIARALVPDGDAPNDMLSARQR